MNTELEIIIDTPASSPTQPLPSDQQVKVFRALGNEMRLHLFYLICEHGAEGICVNDLKEHFDLEQPTISHHLKKLWLARLVNYYHKGLYHFYYAEYDTLYSVIDMVVPLLGILARASGKGKIC